MKSIKVVIMSAGAGPAIAVIKALKRQKEIPVEIIAVDMDRTAAGLYLADDFVIVPPVDEDRFIDFMIGVCKRRSVDFLVPIFDIETPVFAKHRDLFKEEASVEVLVNDYDVISVCNEKKKTYNYCLENAVLAPRIFSHEELESGRVLFPLIRKPNFGIGSKGIIVIRSEKELQTILPLEDGFFLQEYVEGTEYTIDSISDFDGRCLAALPRERMVVKAGQTVKGKTVLNPELMRYGKRVAEIFKIRGPGCSQCIVRDGTIHFIEMNPRYGTGVSLSVGAGLNIPLLHLKLALRQDISERELEFRGNCVMTRYWEEIFTNDGHLGVNGVV